jgi:hypothetical protein
MSAGDYLAGLDDAFCARLTHCTLCRRRSASMYFDIWTDTVLHRAVSIAVCPSCHGTSTWRAAVNGIMQQRYGGAGVSSHE